MQMDTSREVTLIPKNFCKHNRKPTLQKSSLQLRQFDGSVIKTLEYFEGSSELKDKFEVIPIIVTLCKKTHGLVEDNVRNINSTKLINDIKIEKTGQLKNEFKIKRKCYPHLL